MRVPVIGGGGKEHAICRKLRESGRFSKLYHAPGDAGIAEVVELAPIGAMELEKIRDFALREKIDPVVVGTDSPLIGRLTDSLEGAGLKVFGPKRGAAILEGSKAFAKELMEEYETPTTAYESFTDYKAAKRYLGTYKIPVVLKADDPALGKDVLICGTREAAEEGLEEVILERRFSASGDKMVVGEFMTDREVSVPSFMDDKTIRIMANAQDHKRTKDGNRGPNTGSTGDYSPSPYYTDEIARFCEEKIYQRTVDAIAAEGRPFQGVTFLELMLTPDGPRVLEYNVRFSDPGAQVVFLRMENDLLEVMLACVEGRLDEIQLKFYGRTCVTIVLANEGYPVKYEKELPILGLESPKSEPGVHCYRTDTRFDDEGRVITSGSWVLGVMALGKTIHEVRERTYAVTEEISFTSKYMWTDITLAGVAAEEAQQA